MYASQSKYLCELWYQTRAFQKDLSNKKEQM
uniref:Uncharacterized protein n=1 Tax=Rhizophora mucronata TaxID=61149 RepID=A0A2P2PBD0_RHIMU